MILVRTMNSATQMNKESTALRAFKKNTQNAIVMYRQDRIFNVEIHSTGWRKLPPREVWAPVRVRGT